MKASELRIGNYVEESVLGVVTVSTIEPELVWVESKNMKSSRVIESLYYHVNVDSIKPVPLTEEWLLRFGFEKKGGYWHKDRFFIEWLFKRPNLRITINSAESTHANSVEYVHQLQNLYFALTGEELTIKE